MSEIIRDEKKRTKILIIAIVAVVLVSSIVVAYIYNAQKKYTPPPPQPKVELKGNKDFAKESWIAQSSTQMQEQSKKIEQLTTAIKNLQDEKGKPSGDKDKDKMPSATPPLPQAKGSFPPPPPFPGDLGMGQQGKTAQRADLQTQQKVMTNLIAVDEGKSSQKSTDKGTTPSDKKSTQDQQRKEASIPAGSFVKTILLSGVDAPSGGKGKGSPYPVLAKILDLAQFPNHWRGDIQDCFIIGEAYGELSSERAQIRANTLSCVNKKGDILETSVSGYFVGEDGKTGLLGRVTTKQGAMLARSLIAGFLQGVSQAFSQSATVVNVSPYGNISTIDPSKSAQAGIGMGVSKATEELSKFYIEMAKDMFPVVEVNAGRISEVVFLNRVSLKKVDN